LSALESGLPDCAGVALGLDRLVMIDQGLDDIRDAVTFTPGN
jgi:lysyl-tRNA synthetase class 2